MGLGSGPGDFRVPGWGIWRLFPSRRESELLLGFPHGLTHLVPLALVLFPAEYTLLSHAVRTSWKLPMAQVRVRVQGAEITLLAKVKVPMGCQRVTFVPPFCFFQAANSPWGPFLCLTE